MLCSAHRGQIPYKHAPEKIRRPTVCTLVMAESCTRCRTNFLPVLRSQMRMEPSCPPEMSSWGLVPCAIVSTRSWWLLRMRLNVLVRSSIW